MIIEKIPEIQSLTAEQKTALARELWSEAEADSTNPEREAQLRILEERWKHYENNPGTASTWDEVKRRIQERSRK